MLKSVRSTLRSCYFVVTQCEEALSLVGVLVTSLPLCHSGRVPDDWTRLARAVRERREALGFTQTEAVSRAEGAISISLWRNVEKEYHPPFSRPKLSAVCRVLGWEAESVDLLLKGGDPIEVAPEPVEPPEPVLTPAELTIQLAELRQRVEAIEQRTSAEGRASEAEAAYKAKLSQQLGERTGPLQRLEEAEGQQRAG